MKKHTMEIILIKGKQASGKTTIIQNGKRGRLLIDHVMGRSEQFNFFFLAGC